MDRLNEYATLLNEFVNKNNVHVLTITNVVKTIAEVVRNYLLGNVPCSCKDIETSTCIKKLLKFCQYPVLLKIGRRRSPIKERRELIVLNAVLRIALQKLQKDPRECCNNRGPKELKELLSRYHGTKRNKSISSLKLALSFAKTFIMTSCEAAKYFDKFKLVPREMGSGRGHRPKPTNGIQSEGQLGDSANMEDLNRLKLLKLQENGDLSRLQQTHDDMEIFRKPNLGAEGISTLMERAENRHRVFPRKNVEGNEDPAEPINETLDGRMNRLEAYLHRMIQATEGVSRNILKQRNVPPTLKSNVVEQIDRSSSDYVKHSPMKASSAYKADTPHDVSKIVKKPYAINPAERVKTKHRKVMKGADFINFILLTYLMVGKLYFSREILKKCPFEKNYTIKISFTYALQCLLFH